MTGKQRKVVPDEGICKPWEWMSHKWDGEAWNNKRPFQYFYTHALEAVPAGKCKGTERNPTLQTLCMLTTSQNPCMKGNSSTFLCSLISKDVRPNVRASQSSQCSPTHCQCLICNNYGLSESRNNASLLNPCGTWHNRNLINDLKTPTYIKHATAAPACDQGMGTICDTRLYPVLQVPTVGITASAHLLAQEARVWPRWRDNILTCFSNLLLLLNESQNSSDCSICGLETTKVGQNEWECNRKEAGEVGSPLSSPPELTTPLS